MLQCTAEELARSTAKTIAMLDRGDIITETQASHSAPWSRLASWARGIFFYGVGGGDKFREIIVAGVSRDSL
jgi:hypothetical protein